MDLLPTDGQGPERAGRAAAHAGLFRPGYARGCDHAAISLLDRSRRVRSHGSDPCRLRAYVVVVQAPADQAAPQGKAIRADRARLADGAPSAAAAETGLQAAGETRREREFLQAARDATRGGDETTASL